MNSRAEYRAIKAEYAFNGDVMCDDSAKVRALKRIIEGLPLAERTLLLMYVDCGSYRELEKKLGVNYTTLYYRIQPIKRKVKEELAKLCRQ